MIGPYLLKVTAFTIITLEAHRDPSFSSIAFGLIPTIIDEGYKSGLWNVKTPLWYEDAGYAIEYIKKNGRTENGHSNLTQLVSLINYLTKVIY